MLKIEHLKKVYPKSDRVAVDDISIELRPGEIFGFLGQNGAGKSTTIKCLTGILPYDEGTIEVCGYDLAKEPIKAKMNMGYVPDNHSVYEKLTGREYVNYVADLYRVSKKDRTERLERFLDLFKLRFAVDSNRVHARALRKGQHRLLLQPQPRPCQEAVPPRRDNQRGSPHRLLRSCGARGEQGEPRVEERFFKITGTYERRLFEDYVAQEKEEFRPDLYKQEDSDPGDAEQISEE